MLTRLRILLLILLAVIIGANVFLPSRQAPLPPVAKTEPVHMTVVTPEVSRPTVQAVATSAPAVTPKKSPPTKATAVTKNIVVAPPAPEPQPTQSEFDLTASTLRNALVNILCISPRQDIHSISGSGVIVDPRGTIITNAHIAQYFLYTGDPSLQVACVVRAGSPARNAYKAALMYLPAAWVNANKNILTTTNPSGNGEYDFAFLAVTGSASIPLQKLPDAFPFIPLGEGDASTNLPIVIGSYAAQFLTSNEIQSSLYPTIVFGSIKDIYTFASSTIDVITVSGSAASQEGSSGGGIAKAPGELIGIVTTSTSESDTAHRTLGGITASYIQREYEKETGASLNSLFANPPAETAGNFLPQVSTLRAILTAALSQ